jgi:hypothetical protein
MSVTLVMHFIALQDVESVQGYIGYSKGSALSEDEAMQLTSCIKNTRE